MNYSPLRYPGGKARIAPLIECAIKSVSPAIDSYYEPFCGGAGVALYLLMNNQVEHIFINDYDRAIYSFWKAVFFDTSKLIDMIIKTPINVYEWQKQKYIYMNATKYSVDYAFATLFLNRTNRSGIISAGPIGGYSQSGDWKIDARYNKENIVNRIASITTHKKRVTVNNMDVRRYIKSKNLGHTSFVFFDPPYVNNAKRLYKNSLSVFDHAEIAKTIQTIQNANWLVTYDDTELIRQLYVDCNVSNLEIQYSVAQKRKENELLITKR
jgi:DNA adenine methylase